jgi:hypothetical protein
VEILNRKKNRFLSVNQNHETIMKKKFLNILVISSILTTIGFLMDGDAKEPSILVRFAEFFGMVGILFLLISTIYFVSTFVFKSFQRV